MQRTNDPDTAHFFQTERFFSANMQWYFSTRETGDKGPFNSRAAAEEELTGYLMQFGLNANPWDTPGASN